MTRQFLRVLRRDTSVHQFRYEPVPQAVEVGNPAVGVAVGQEPGRFPFRLLRRRPRLGQPRGAGGGQVELDEVGRFVVQCPLARPQRFTRLAPHEPRTQLRDQGEMKRNLIAAAVLRVRGLDRDNRRRGVEGEGTGRQARQFGRTQPGHTGDQIEHRPIRPGQPAEGHSGAGGVEQAGELVGGERTANVPNVHLHVHAAQVAERVLGRAPGLHQPVPERFERDRVVIARLGRDATVLLGELPAVGQPALRGGPGEVGELRELATSEHDLTAPANLLGLLLGVAAVGLVRFVLAQQLGQGALTVVGVLVADAGLLVLDLLEEVRQHDGGGIAVRGEPDALPLAVR
nr:hypothetical protein [Frigoriglobus tundricola]